MRIVFHGKNAATFHDGLSARLDTVADLVCLPDDLINEPDRNAYSQADVVVATQLSSDQPRPLGAKLFQVAGAGIDAIDRPLLPATTTLCNCYGHDVPIAEYVLGALLSSQIPYVQADQQLRQGDWTFQSGNQFHGELTGRKLGILGFGHIGRAIARVVRPLGVTVHAANRSPVNDPLVDAAYTLDALTEFYRSIDDLVVALPQTPATKGLVAGAAFDALPAHARVINVGRGGVVDAESLYLALSDKQIAGAVIDTWYRYPNDDNPHTQPSDLPFHELDNILMTPHMSGWTRGTIERRKDAIAENINRLASGKELVNVIY
ncbi:2-hydroxyacid dehydrogenase [Chromohalobacter sp. 296-RDG]|uniref:2-hydroxyacid dehydrogenase n=1 Tax=Chromohalobacter sp. 296-RDG TaxID=2994062 RepID=UPI0024693A24|nr:2-hydroxyacid dehydrogenase [Chromohalobacter sp. 296-RDG]